MEFISTLNAIKSVFSTLGAKTSDSNYAVQLCDKTSGEPKGFMGMSDLASVLGGLKALEDSYDIDADTLNTPSTINIYTGVKTKAELHLPDFGGNSGISQVAVTTVIAPNSNFGFQIAYSYHDTSKYYIRFKWGDWHNMPTWKLLSLT